VFTEPLPSNDRWDTDADTQGKYANNRGTAGGRYFLCSPTQKLYKENNSRSAVSWEFHDPQSHVTVKYSNESRGLGTKNDCPGKDQQQLPDRSWSVVRVATHRNPRVEDLITELLPSNGHLRGSSLMALFLLSGVMSHQIYVYMVL
jgi:hypothetical protein